jgi:hypothetical protein
LTGRHKSPAGASFEVHGRWLGSYMRCFGGGKEFPQGPARLLIFADLSILHRLAQHAMVEVAAVVDAAIHAPCASVFATNAVDVRNPRLVNCLQSPYGNLG